MHCGILDQKKDSSGKTGEIQIKSAVWFVAVSHHWFLSGDKCTVEMQDVNIREAGECYTRALCTIFATFLQI